MLAPTCHFPENIPQKMPHTGDLTGEIYGLPWCGRGDSNPHECYLTATSTLRVYQFRHDRTAGDFSSRSIKPADGCCEEGFLAESAIPQCDTYLQSRIANAN